MALNIPLPMAPDMAFSQGLNRGTNLFEQMMQRAMQQKQLAENARQFETNKAWQREQFEALAPYRQAQLQNMQASMSLNPLRRMLLEQQVQAARNANDPTYEFRQFQTLQNMLMGGGAPQAMQQPEMPRDIQGEGMGMFTPEGLQGAQQETMQQQPSQGGINYDLLRQQPVLRGIFKKKFGYDPLAQTPEDKQNAALDLFRQKEQIKALSKSGDMPTNKVLTQNQQAIQAIDTVVPMIDEFINNPNLVFGATDISRSKKAAYEAKTGGMIDMLVAAQSLPQVKESVNLVEQQIRRGWGESTESYIKRLKDFRKDLLSRREKSQKLVSSKRVNTMPFQDLSTMSEDELRRIAGGG